MLVIRDLADGRSRFCELERSLQGISPRTLSLRLRALEEEGIVRRQTFPEVPPRVEYALTEKGRALVPIIESMRAYGTEWLGAPGPRSEPPEVELTAAAAGGARRSSRRAAESALAFRPTYVQPAGSCAGAANRRAMHNRALHDSLAA